MRLEPCNGIVLTVTTSSVVASRPCLLTHVSLNPAAAAATVSLYDPLPNTTTTVGATLRVTLVAAASVSSTHMALDSAVEFSNGCVAVVTGTGATANVGTATV